MMMISNSDHPVTDLQQLLGKKEVLQEVQQALARTRSSALL
jgi:hypothetical protein